MAEFKDRIEEALNMRDMKPAELSRLTEISEGAISQYRKGIYNATQRNLEKLANALRVPIPWLMGISDSFSFDLPGGLTSIENFKKVPLIGTIACGTPILAEENIEGYIDAPGHIHADYALTCKGNSMINAGIKDGDIVYIHKQETVENGQIAAVMVGQDEATLKRFYADNGVVTLNAENPAYPPKTFVGEEAAQIHVLGLAVAFLHHMV